INLNRNLMLMPPETVDYVLYHELVHLKVLNHSAKFWKELERLFPNYKKGLSQLKDFESNKIPSWALV
ncbi:M48 family metallopeptidase, partial [Dehalococcoidia bacterium]|nr:M48 family metallopeptidase [Dehalococcoidia bacterium]